MRLSLLATAMVAAVAATAGSPAVPPPPEENQSRPPAPAIATGWSKAEVADRFGLPSKIWESEVWVYWNYNPTHAGNGGAGYDTLVVIFEGGRVQRVRLVNGVALHELMDFRQRMLAQDTSLRAPSGPPRQALVGVPVAPALGKKQP